MSLTDKKHLQAALTMAGLPPNKLLGQHFLIDEAALDNIIKSAQIDPHNTILEIGPGVGTLTDRLVTQANRVVAVEKDDRFADYLKRKYPSLELIISDFLHFDLGSVGQYSVVANLPYYVTAKIIQKLLTSENKPRSITILIQKEVAQRITAEPGKMSVLALSVQYFGRPKIVDLVPSASFWPAPEVDSAILHVDIFSEPVFSADQKRLFRLIKAGFSERRKMLHNALSGGLAIDQQRAAQLISTAKLPANVRAQELSLVDWHSLYQACLNGEVI